MFRLARNLVCAVVLCVFAAAAHAQLTTSRVNVYIPGLGCEKLDNVYLVIDDEDLEDRWIPLEKAEKVCHWTADLGEDGSFSTTLSHFSLRILDVARTDCRQATAKEETRSAELEFSCCSNQGPLHNLRVTTEPPIPVSYLRKVPKNVPKADEKRLIGVDCVEFGSFPAGAGAIRQTRFLGEDVLLQFGNSEAKQKAPGLLIDSIVVNDRPVTLTRDDVTYQMTVQRAQGKAGSAPTLSSNAISLEIKRLTDLKLERTRIEVTK